MLKQVLSLPLHPATKYIMEFVLITTSSMNKAKAAAEIQYIFKSVAPAIAVLK
jgi:hypothetical protein